MKTFQQLVYSVSLVCFLYTAHPAHAETLATDKAPKIAKIPDGLPADQDGPLRKHLADIAALRNTFNTAMEGYNQTPRTGIEVGSPQESELNQKIGAVNKARAAYIFEVMKFNRKVASSTTAMITNSPCLIVAQLQTQFQSLNQQIALDQQVLRNFGFEKTVAEIEYWGNLSARQVEDAKNTFKNMLFDAALGSISEAAHSVGSLTSGEIDALNRLADAQGGPSLGIVAGAKDVHRALEFLDKAKGGYEAADAARKGQMLDAALKLGGLACKNPAYNLLLTADAWAAYQVFNSITAVKTVHNLTKVLEGDLILLKARSEKLTTEVNQLTGVKKELAKLSSECDSSNLVKKTE